MTMALEHQDEAGSTVVRVSGELDLSTGPELESYVRQLLDAGPPESVVLDLSDVAFVDSSGVSAMMRVWRLCQRLGSRLEIGAMSTFVARVLDVTGLLEILAPRRQGYSAT